MKGLSQTSGASATRHYSSCPNPLISGFKNRVSTEMRWIPTSWAVWPLAVRSLRECLVWRVSVWTFYKSKKKDKEAMLKAHSSMTQIFDLYNSFFFQPSSPSERSLSSFRLITRCQSFLNLPFEPSLSPASRCRGGGVTLPLAAEAFAANCRLDGLGEPTLIVRQGASCSCWPLAIGGAQRGD